MGVPPDPTLCEAVNDRNTDVPIGIAFLTLGEGSVRALFTRRLFPAASLEPGKPATIKVPPMSLAFQARFGGQFFPPDSGVVVACT